MGKRHFKGNNSSEDKKRRKDFADKWKNTRGDGNNNNTKKTWELENPRFTAFYKAQHFIKETDGDWDNFMKHLQAPLPACFRINPDYPFASELRNQMLSFVGEVITLDNGAEIKPAEQLSWFPNGYGYKLGADRRAIRKLDNLHNLHQWMMQHTENGNITRQEAVSMVPPLALDVAPHHKCLDMCAAPGSKTSQLLEIVNRSLISPSTEQGLVVANDSDTDRAYMLVHQCKRINSPLLIVTTHKGQHFPSIHHSNNNNSSSSIETKTPFFDRVLCDVPCSGDGTLRKNPAIWGKWNTAMGMTLHPLQLMIAKRGLQLLKNDSLMVYSTCSMSPYENEAVVAELLRSANGGLELVDARQFLPLFKTRPGLSEWYVLDDYLCGKKGNKANKESNNKDDKIIANHTEITIDEIKSEVIQDTNEVKDSIINNHEETHTNEDNVDIRCDSNNILTPHPTVVDDDLALQHCLDMGMIYYRNISAVPTHLEKRVRRSMFPPTEEEKQWMHLERCLRCVPQDEDTGGFFVATLRKIGISSKDIPVKTTDNDISHDLNINNNTATTEEFNEEDNVIVENHDDMVNAVDGDVGDDDDTKKEEVISKPSNNSNSNNGHQSGLVDFQLWENASYLKIKEFYGMTEELSEESFFIREDYSTSAKQKANFTGAKSVYFIPYSTRCLMIGDKDSRLKIVSAGVKAFEKKVLHNGDVDYRLLQDGISYLAPFITKRKIQVPIQDFCNMLGGGLVSFNTLTASTIERIQTFSMGVVICWYEYNEADTILVTTTTSTDSVAITENQDPLVITTTNNDCNNNNNNNNNNNINTTAVSHKFYVICWKGHSRTVNVMCGKVDMESMKHQLAALKVLRLKIVAPKETIPSIIENNTITTLLTSDNNLCEHTDNDVMKIES